MKHSHRAGLSLIEVLIATAILMTSAVLLFELAEVGRSHADSAKDKATAQRICQSLLNEVLIGQRPLETVFEQPLADDPGWTWSLEIQPLELPLSESTMVAVRVTVAGEAIGQRAGEQFTLWRWVHIPRTPASEDDSQAVGFP